MNQTPFYGESGGQVGDTGIISNEKNIFKVLDVQKKLGNLFVHYGIVEKGSFNLNDNVELKIDIERRENVKAYHSATHLLHESLRRTLGTHVMQKGSLVAPDRLRFDFSHMKPISSDEMTKIEQYVNQIVNKKSEVITRIMTPKEGIAHGALALFGEKYGEEVRVVFMGDEGRKYFSTELCGGTHVKNTNDIGNFKVVSQSAIAAGVRRVEALRDKQLEEFLKNKEDQSNLSEKKDNETIKILYEEIKKLGGNPNLDYENKKDLIKNLNKELEKLSINEIINNKSKNIIKDEETKGIKLRMQKIDGLLPKELRGLVDKGKRQIGEGIVIIFASKDDKVGLAVGVTDKLKNKYDAVKFVKIGSEIIGGKGGGGRSDFAQAGGVNKNKIEDAFKSMKSLI